ncbi:MAG: UDP-N-acetylglucosamine 1-carboxyvinyltransferase [Clostridiales bacterium]|nr:UDP-N-acetylglucosamine 1-carboxyvinyltransferase [Clostridiales bacterium]
MEKVIINGGKTLSGTVDIGGAKNAAVAIIPATLLTRGVCRLENLPDIKDVNIMLGTLKQLGAKVKYINPHTYEIDTTPEVDTEVPDELAKHLRASYYFLGALLGREKCASVAMPGGCDFGVRPIDQHIKGFELLGAKVGFRENAMVEVKAESLLGNQIYLDVVSVGATVNLILAAVLAPGLTTIEQAAKEPHIVDLANFLNLMGAKITGAGTDVIKIHGVKQLKGCTYSIIPDQIEAGTYMVAAAAAGGEVIIRNVIPKHLESITAKLLECGIEVDDDFDDEIHIKSDVRPKRCNVKTLPHPGFPTDMQPQIAVLLSVADGTSIISEGVWDNRFRYVEQLARLGASINVEGKLAVIEGVEHLKGAPIKADDLRAGAAMFIAGLVATGTTEIRGVEHVDRGYEKIVEKLAALGADIKREIVPDPAGSLNEVG